MSKVLPSSHSENTLTSSEQVPPFLAGPFLSPPGKRERGAVRVGSSSPLLLISISSLLSLPLPAQALPETMQAIPYLPPWTDTLTETDANKMRSGRGICNGWTKEGTLPGESITQNSTRGPPKEATSPDTLQHSQTHGQGLGSGSVYWLM